MCAISLCVIFNVVSVFHYHRFLFSCVVFHVVIVFLNSRPLEALMALTYATTLFSETTVAVRMMVPRCNVSTFQLSAPIKDLRWVLANSSRSSRSWSYVQPSWAMPLVSFCFLGGSDFDEL